MNPKYWLFGRRFREEDEHGEGGDARPTPAQLNAQGNNRRLSRMEQIARTADGNRSSELTDVEGENPTGRFAGGEFDESDEAKERRALEADEEAERVLEEQRQRASDEEAQASRLQAEGAQEGAERDGSGASEAGDERVINGVKHYLTIVNGEERWLTLKQLRDNAATAGNAERALQLANDALQRSTDAALSPKPGAEEDDLDEADLENVILSAVMGDGEAVKKLVHVLKRPNSGGIPPDEIARQVSQRLATQRLIDEGEASAQDLLGNKSLGPIFRQRMATIAREKPTMKITDAYSEVAKVMRGEFAPMLPTRQDGGSRPLPKIERKRTLVGTPRAASRVGQGEDSEREETVSSVIDSVAKSRGQDRAIRPSRR